jgi:ankyrin repeat protein
MSSTCDCYLPFECENHRHLAEKMFNEEKCLIRAARSGDIRYLQCILKNRLVPAKSYFAAAALHEAAKNGRQNIVEELLAYGVSVDAFNGSPLCIASSYGYLRIVDTLLSHGANVHACDNGALICAADSGYIRVVQRLIQAGAIVSDQAIILAEEGKHYAIIRLLAKARANVNPSEVVRRILAKERRRRLW